MSTSHYLPVTILIKPGEENIILLGSLKEEQLERSVKKARGMKRRKARIMKEGSKVGERERGKKREQVEHPFTCQVFLVV